MAELLGMEEILNNLEAHLGEARMKQVVSKTLRKSGVEAENDLRQMATTFVRSGATVHQVVKGNVSWADFNIPHIKVGWRRPKEGESPRWNIEHLNEFGYTRNGRHQSTRGFGKMQALVDEYESKYLELAQEGLKELLE